MKNKKPNILIIDDSLINLKLLEEFLYSNGYKVTSVSNPAQAMDLIKDHNFDLLITDYEMPEYNGFDIIKELKKTKKSKTPVLIMSSKTTSELVNQSKTIGADAWITKPFDKTELQNRLNTLLSKQKRRFISILTLFLFVILH